MQVKTVYSNEVSPFESIVNDALSELNAQGKRVLDIKYSGVSSTGTESALIVLQ